MVAVSLQADVRHAVTRDEAKNDQSIGCCRSEDAHAECWVCQSDRLPLTGSAHRLG